jgi:hypothetical protein
MLDVTSSNLHVAASYDPLLEFLATHADGLRSAAY